MPPKSIDSAFTATNLHAPGTDPTFAGALSFMRRLYTKNLDGVDIAVWGVPFDAATSNRPGTRFGPQAIRRASAIFDSDPQYPFDADLFEKLNVIDYGDCLLDYSDHQSSPGAIEGQASVILNAGAFLLTLGGDHYVTFPLLRAHSKIHGPVALIQFDAHQDTWHEDPSRISHGSFVKGAVREGIIDPASSIQVGIRTHAPETCGIDILYGYDVEDMTAAEIAAAIKARVGDRKCYITFDIDCLDPAFAPGTGTPVAGGPSSAKMLSVLMKLKELNLVGADVVEVSPPYDHADITAIAGATIAMHYIGLLHQKAK